MREKTGGLSGLRGDRFFPWVIAALLLLLFTPEYLRAETANEPEVIRFGVFPYKSSKALIGAYQPLAARLEKRLGKKIQLVSAADATSFVEQVTRGGYDLIILPSTVYFKVREKGYKVIARGMPGFYTGVIVRKDSGITGISQLRGKEVAVKGAYSSAYALLSSQFADQGIQCHFRLVSGTDSLAQGVLAKKYDAGLVRLDTLDSFELSDVRDQFAIILRSAEIPQFPIAARSSLDANVVTSIRQALAELSPDVPEDLKILERLQVTVIIAASDADYQDFFDQIKGSPDFQ